jgi:hypothetical protein
LALIPTPVSSTAIMVTPRLSCYNRMVMRPCGGVNLIAFDNKLMMIC